MAIAPFRACRHSLPPGQLWEAPIPSATAFCHLDISHFSSTKVATPHPTPAIYSYHHRQDNSRLEGVVALFEGDSLKQFRNPMPATVSDLAFARECLSSNREQLAPVLALYDAPAIPGLESNVEEPLAEDELRIEPILAPLALQELGAELSNLPLTVIVGQEWIEAAPHQPCMVLLVNLRTCAPELQAVHCTARWKPGWHAGDMVRLGREHFFFSDITRSMPRICEAGPRYSRAVAEEHLRPKQPGENVYIAVTAQHTFRIHSLPGWADTVLAHRSPEERAVSTVQLRQILLPDGLQIPPENMDDKQVSYTDNMDEAVARVIQGEADVAFLMNAPTIEQIVAVARTGGSIPPHAFRPRLAPVPGAITYAF